LDLTFLSRLTILIIQICRYYFHYFIFQLLTGTTDFEIRVQKKDTMLWETKETAAIVVFTDLPNRQFAYALENGTIGVYEAGQRLWRVKVRLLHAGEILKCLIARVKTI